MSDRRRPPIRPPAWLAWVGAAMSVVGAVGLIVDIQSNKSGASLVIDLMLDVFLVVAGLVIFLATRRA